MAISRSKDISGGDRIASGFSLRDVPVYFRRPILYD
jgi:hypothetical protein